MRFESKLCHFSDTKVIVKVNGWLNEKNLGSSLAEGPTVEIAEDKAISRLNKRLKISINDNSILKSKHENEINMPLEDELQKNDNTKNDIINKEPSDWSNELTSIDLEIERLKWTREDEINFLISNLGINNRNKITKYIDIVNYLKMLKNIDYKSYTNVTNSLIEQSDNVLRDLKWDHKQGREFLQKEFNVLTRKELDEKQLTSFLSKLKSIRNQHLDQ